MSGDHNVPPGGPSVGWVSDGGSPSPVTPEVIEAAAAVLTRHGWMMGEDGLVDIDDHGRAHLREALEHAFDCALYQRLKREQA